MKKSEDIKERINNIIHDRIPEISDPPTGIQKLRLASCQIELNEALNDLVPKIDLEYRQGDDGEWYVWFDFEGEKNNA